MRQQNHASPKRGIAKLKLQGSAAPGLKTLQSQTRQGAGNRLSLNALAVVHGRLSTINRMRREGNDTIRASYGTSSAPKTIATNSSSRNSGTSLRASSG